MAATDLLVVGGGPAGLATAVAGRRRGLAVTVLERRRPPFDKACGEGLMPDAVAALRRLGVDPLPVGREIAGIRWLDERSTAEGTFPGGPGRGVRRTELHRALVVAAEAAGVELRWGTRVTGWRRGAVEVAGRPLAAPWIVAADGLRSPLRRWAGLDLPVAGRRRFGVRRHYRLAPWSDRVEVYWAAGAEAYVTPVGAEEVGVAILWGGGHGSFDRLLPRFPALVGRLGAAAPCSRDRGAGPFRQRARRRLAPGPFLVGDAGGYVDAITGEGLGIALHEAEALADALSAGRPASYRRRARRLRRLPSLLTELLLIAERRPALRRRLLAALARRPGLFDQLLGLAAGQVPARSGVGPVAGRLALALLRG